MTKSRAASEPPLGPMIRKRRKQLGLTLQQLCDVAGLSVGYLSQVERENATPTLGTLAQIAEGLGVELDYFVSQPRPSDALTRSETRPQFSIAGSSVGYEALFNEYPGSELSSYVLTVPPGYTSETVSHEGEEIIYILDGTIDQTLDGEIFRMTAGDSLHYPGSTPHSWTNPGESPARILWTGTLAVLHRKGSRRLPLQVAANDNEND